MVYNFTNIYKKEEIMDKDKLLAKIEDIQLSVKQMIQDDIDENPEASYEEFQCDCCGKTAIFAGSMIYEDYRICNDCATLAEVGFALNKIKNIQELMDSMEDKRFEEVYDAIFNTGEQNPESPN